MMKVRSILMTVAIGGGMLLAAATANAQLRPGGMPNPSAQNTAEAQRKGPCRDPWITVAYWMYTAGIGNPNGSGDVMECDKMLYRGGRWNNFNELYEAVYNYKQALKSEGLSTVAVIIPRGRKGDILPGGGKGFALVNRDKRVVGGALIGSDGASIIGNDAASIIGNDAASLIGSDGATLKKTVAQRLVAAGAGNMVAAGGGNFRLLSTGTLSPLRRYFF